MARTEPTGTELYWDEFGQGSPVLVLIHGQGANGDVWDGLRPLVARGWPGRCVIPDLRGHGRSRHRAPYGYGTYAADIADLLGPDQDAVLVGHSLGGAVSLTLASGWFGVTVRRVVAFGVKVIWTEEERARRAQLATAPVRWFETRAEAIERYLKVSGQFGLVDPASPAAASGVREAAGRFRLAADPRISGGTMPEIAAIHAAAAAPVTLAVSANDRMMTVAETRGLDPNAVVLEGVGHNAHIERPDLIWGLIEGALI
jgi:pimeloyl-ACP methyl ester carboxylesterase